MKKFNSPQITVVKFMNDDVITTSSGYSGNVTETDFDLLGTTTAAYDSGDDPTF